MRAVRVHASMALTVTEPRLNDICMKKFPKTEGKIGIGNYI